MTRERQNFLFYHGPFCDQSKNGILRLNENEVTELLSIRSRHWNGLLKHRKFKNLLISTGGLWEFSMVLDIQKKNKFWNWNIACLHTIAVLQHAEMLEMLCAHNRILHFCKYGWVTANQKRLTIIICWGLTWLLLCCLHFLRQFQLVFF